ncbi:hypothetical protein K469DRAFT_379615 [Zopfia rhizophila CBS 207.26]|uniref:Uncharacterized protein n=1 Tax=Zopfia rhizophila CBS 207.26 TaxID=1314779 RepID=A0A6A6DG56_9PEZI|nr:hypothetical protein K469DRAFT_379615 [Zopfia rhizophila CBS 207.26]
MQRRQFQGSTMFSSAILKWSHGRHSYSINGGFSLLFAHRSSGFLQRRLCRTLGVLCGACHFLPRIGNTRHETWVFGTECRYHR